MKEEVQSQKEVQMEDVSNVSFPHLTLSDLDSLGFCVESSGKFCCQDILRAVDVTRVSHHLQLFSRLSLCKNILVSKYRETGSAYFTC